MTNEQTKQSLEQQHISEHSSKNKEKDNWDKLATLSPFLSSIVIGVIGIYFANAYKSQEVRVGEIQVVEKFIPILAGTNEDAKKGALLSIASLSNQDLAIRLGTSYASPGTIAAMEILLKAAKGENEQLLREALIDAYYSRAGVNSDADKNYDQIIDDINKILKLKPVNDLKMKYDGYFLADCYQMLGFAYYNIDKYDDAYENFRKSLEIIPNYSRGNWGLGALFWGRNDREKSLDRALDYYNQAVANNPDKNIFLYRGQLQREMGRNPEALDDFDQYISFRPNDSQGYIEKATTYQKTGDYSNAKDNLKTARVYANDPAQQANIDRIIREIDNKMKTIGANTTEQVKQVPKTHWQKGSSRKNRPKSRS